MFLLRMLLLMQLLLQVLSISRLQLSVAAGTASVVALTAIAVARVVAVGYTAALVSAHVLGTLLRVLLLSHVQLPSGYCCCCYCLWCSCWCMYCCCCMCCCLGMYCSSWLNLVLHVLLLLWYGLLQLHMSLLVPCCICCCILSLWLMYVLLRLLFWLFHVLLLFPVHTLFTSLEQLAQMQCELVAFMWRHTHMPQLTCATGCIFAC